MITCLLVLQVLKKRHQVFLEYLKEVQQNIVQIRTADLFILYGKLIITRTITLKEIPIRVAQAAGNLCRIMAMLNPILNLITVKYFKDSKNYLEDL